MTTNIKYTITRKKWKCPNCQTIVKKRTDNEYNRASASYTQMLDEYTSMLSDVIDILESFPNKLY